MGEPVVIVRATHVPFINALALGWWGLHKGHRRSRDGGVMEASVEWREGTKMTAYGNDAELEMDWSGEGLSPVMVTLQAVGACSLVDIIIGLKEREVTEANVELTAERAEDNPRVFTRIHMTYHVRGSEFPLKLIERLIEQSHTKYCTISNMLKHTAEITWDARLNG